jgi:hypothetical protein
MLVASVLKYSTMQTDEQSARFSKAYLFFANRTQALKKKPNNTKHPKKNENYNEILEKPLSASMFSEISFTC